MGKTGGRKYAILTTCSVTVPAFAFTFSLFTANCGSAQSTPTATAQTAAAATVVTTGTTPKPGSADAPAYAPASYYSIGKKSALKWEYGTKPTTATPGFFQIKDGAATDDSDVNIVATTPSGIVAARLDLVIQFKFKSSDIDLFTIPIRVTGVAWDPKTKQYPLKAVLKDVAKVLIDKINERRGTDFGPTHTVPAAVEATITVTPSIPQMAGAVSFFAAQEVAIPKAIPFSLNKAEPPKAEPIVIDQPTATETQQSQPKVEGAIKKSQPASHPAPVQPQ